MEMQGERIIAAPRDEVWRALNDPQVLKESIPGCQEMEKTSDTSFAATVKQKVGPVSATFKGSVELTDIVEAESYRISGEGKGGAAGFAKGGAKVDLEDVEEGTKLSYDVEAKVGGKLAQLGARVVDGFAKKMADQFFDRFKAHVEGPGDEDPALTDPVAAEPAAEPAPGIENAETPEPATPGDDEATVAERPSEEEAETAEKKSWFRRVLGT